MFDLGFLQDQSGFAVASAGLFGMLFGILSGKAVDQFGRKNTAYLSIIIMIIGNLSFFILFIPSPLFLFAIVSMAIIGTGSAFYSASFNTISTELMPDIRATVASFSSAFRFLAISTFTLFIPIYVTYGFGAIVLISAVSLVLGGIIFIPLKVTHINLSQLRFNYYKIS